jgi:hypothetical protein
MGRIGGVCAALVISVAPCTGEAALRSERAALFALARPDAPPPRAPYHGHRHRHRSGVELRFDAELGAYVVPDAHALYYFAGAFARIHEGVWQASDSLDGPWRPLRAEWIPYPLRAMHYANER